MDAYQDDEHNDAIDTTNVHAGLQILKDSSLWLTLISHQIANVTQSHAIQDLGERVATATHLLEQICARRGHLVLWCLLLITTCVAEPPATSFTPKPVSWLATVTTPELDLEPCCPDL